MDRVEGVPVASARGVTRTRCEKCQRFARLLPGDANCSATYTMASQWNNGFQGDVRVTAGSTAIRGWSVTMRFPDGQTVGQIWNASATSNGTTTTARNVDYNGNLAAGASTSFGFTGSWANTNRAPTLSCTATA